MSNLFKPYRAVGVYSGNAPGIVYFHGRRRYHIAEIPIDNCFHSYKGKNWSRMTTGGATGRVEYPAMETTKTEWFSV